MLKGSWQVLILQHCSICLLHLFCALLLWSTHVRSRNVAVVDVLRNAQIFFATECRGRRHWDGSHQHLLSPPQTLSSINLIMRISSLLGFVPERYLSEWFLRICLTFPSAFVRAVGWSNYPLVALS